MRIGRGFRVSRRRVVLAAAVIVSAAAWARFGPLPPGLLEAPARRSMLVVDRHGEVLYEARSGAGDRSVRLAASSLPDTLVRATLAAEDRRFWWHPGVDPVAIARAAWRNLASGRVREGGSTITQQVAKLLLAQRYGRRAGWRAKAYEGIVALRLEHRLSKREILTLYLNLAPYGNQFVGAERASLAYFGRSCATLTSAEAAFLAALPQRPSSFNPWREPRRARSRQQAILRRMHAAGALSGAELSVALAEELSLTPPDAALTAPHFVELAIAQAAGARPPTLQTTLDAGLQRDVQAIVRARRADLARHGAHNVAVVVLDNQTGGWLAWEGSGDYFDAEHGGAIDGARAPRQPGSALKPFTYALAFDRGYAPASVLPDVPSHFPTAEPGVFYSPRNYDGLYRGPLRARAALAGSENVPAVALLSEVGPASLLRLLRRAGLTTLDKSAAHYGLGLTLGNAEVRLDELTGAYAALARGGVAVSPSALRRGDTPPLERIVSHRAAYWVTDILADADAREYAFGRGGSLEFPFPVAAKTGTSQAYHDNWTIGFTREVTVGVWVGNFDRTPLRRSSGVTGAGPIFHAVMLASMRRLAPAAVDAPPRDVSAILPPPPDAVRRRICLLSGMAAGASCPRHGAEWLAAESAPASCTWHRAGGDGTVTVWPAEYRAWAAERGLIEAAGPAVAAAAHLTDGSLPRMPPRRGVRAARAQRLEIVSPPPGAIYLIDPTLRREFQTLPLRARGARGEVRWEIDGRIVARRPAAEAAEWPLAPGRHTVAAIDQAGRAAQGQFVVR